LALASMTGCQSGLSMPSSNWLSWGKKPSTTALSSNIKKPTAGQLPTPSATTAGASSLAATGGARPYGQTGFQYPGAQPTSSGYQTGPYNTGGASSYQPTNSSLASAPPYGGAATGPYQSPYQSNQQPAQSGYLTADARNGGSYGASPSPQNPWGGNANSGATATSPYAGATATSPYAAQSPTATNPQRSYGAGPYDASSYGGSPYSSGGYQQPASYQQPIQGSADITSGTSGYPTPSAGAYSPSSSATSGQYRPGSTGRNSQLLNSSGQTSAAYGTAAPGSYPTTSNYPSTALGQSWNGGSASPYPTTGQ